MESYTGRDDAFFYSLVYDPHNKSLVADRGEIRIGSSYQVIYFISLFARRVLSDLVPFRRQ